MYEYYPELTEYVKVNFPTSESEYLYGCGEGVWVLVDADTKAAYDKDEHDLSCVGLIENDSFYYPTLTHGRIVYFELRGDNAAVASWDFLCREAYLGGYDPAARKAEVLKKLFASLA